MREDLVRAEASTPRDPAVHELLGLIEARSGNRPEYASAAIVHFLKALELRPTSPYTWANLAALRYRVGDTEPGSSKRRHSTRRSWERSSRTCRAIVANFGLAVWDETGGTDA